MLRYLLSILLFVALSFGEPLSAALSDSLHRKVLSDKEIFHLIDSLTDMSNPDQFIIMQLKEYISVRQKSTKLFNEREFEHKWSDDQIDCNDAIRKPIIDSTLSFQYSDYHRDFIIPAKGIITSDYGWRRRSFHSGVDIDLRTGDEVIASFDGVVKIAKVDRGYGKVVILKHSNGLETTYAHLSKFKVKVGQTLTAGAVIGLGGNTGKSRGSHLHYEIRYNGIPINPNYFISFDQNKLQLNKVIVKNNTPTFNLITDANKTHRVQKGDSLYRIARQYGISLKELKSLNGIKNNTKLKIGTELKVG